MLKSIRKIGLLVSSFALACSVALGVALLPKTVATAEDGMSISTADLVKSSTMTVTPAYENAGLAFTATEKNKAAELKGSFNGDLKVEYSLWKSGNGEFHFEFYADNEETPVFTITRYSKYNNSNSFVLVSYQAEKGATTQYVYVNKSTYELITTEMKPNRTESTLLDGATPFWHTTSYSASASGKGSFTLDWSDNNQLTIKHTYSTVERTVANLDLSAWEGLSSSYTMKLQNNSSSITNVLLRSVNGVSLASETVAVTQPTTAITYEGETEVNGIATINLAKGENLGSFIAIKPAMIVGGNWTVATAEDETFSYEEDFSSKNPGTYAISVENGGFAKAYNVVVNSTIATADLVKSSTMTVTPAYENAGLYLEKTADYQSTTMDGTFNGDLTIEYSLIKTGVAPLHFNFYDENDQFVFRVIRFAKYNDNNALWASTAYVGYKLSAESDIQYSYLNADSELVSGVETINRADPIGYAIPTSNATSYEKCGTGSLTLDWSDNNQLEIKHTYQSGEKTIANLDLSDWEGLSSEYKLGIAYDSNWGAHTNLLLRSVNGVSLAGETVSAAKIANSVSDIAYAGATNNQIVVSQNAMLGNFVATADYLVAGNWTVDVNEEFAVDASTATLGDNTLTVTNENYSEDFNLKVIYKTMEDLDLEMAYGASVRIGSSDGHNGIRFSMCIEDYEAWQASIGEGQYYTSVSYGMFIMPSDYYTATGAYTLENLFGEEAIYTWKNKAEAYGTTQILHRSGSQMFWDEKNSWWAFNYSITDIHKDNIGRDFVALGYVELTLSDGSVVRKLAQFNEGNIANNTRSAYTVAKKAIEAGIDETSALWLKANYIDVVENSTAEN